MGRIIRRLKQLRFPPFDRGDYSMDGERRVENTDALGAAQITAGERPVGQRAGMPLDGEAKTSSE